MPAKLLAPLRHAEHVSTVSAAEVVLRPICNGEAVGTIRIIKDFRPGHEDILYKLDDFDLVALDEYPMEDSSMARPKRNEKIKFEAFADEYVEVYLKPNNRSWLRAEAHNIKRLKAHFSGKYLHEITPLMVEKFKIERAKEVSPATTNRTLTCIKSIFNRAITWGKFKGDNPVNKVKFFIENNTRLRYLEKEEIVKLLKNCKGYLKPIVVFALNTGMRRGEILNLKWQDVDFRRGIIYLLRTKNDERREIPMNEAVKTALVKARKHPNSPYIFCGKNGKPFYNVRKSFLTALKKSGIANFHFHDLRHTFASHLVTSGVDLNTVRELMGHKSLDMTLRYAHLSPDHKKRTVDTLGKRMDSAWIPMPIAVKSREEAVATI